MDKKFNLTLDSLVYMPFVNYLSKENLSHDYSSDQPDFHIVMDNYTHCDIYNLGYSVCSYSINWNRAIETKIRQRSELNFLGKPIFGGSDHERDVLNELDKNKLIEYPNQYFENFITEVRTKNQGNIEKYIINKEVEFEIIQDFEDSVVGVYDYCNQKFGSGFKLRKIYLDDTMFFAQFMVTRTSLIDVFCLGYLVALKDAKKTEVMRFNNGAKN